MTPPNGCLRRASRPPFLNRPARLVLIGLVLTSALLGCSPVPRDDSSAAGPAAAAPPSEGGETSREGGALSATTTEGKPPAHGPGPAETTPPPSATAAEGLSQACRDAYAEIQALEKQIPVVFYGLTRSADQINQDMVRLVDLCRQFLRECRGVRTADCFVKTTLARMLVGREARFLAELEEEKLSSEKIQEVMRARREEIVELTEGAGTDCEKGSGNWFTSQRMVQEIYLKTSRFDEVRRIAEELIQDNAPYDIRTGAIDTVVKSFMYERKFDDAIRFLHQILDRYSSDPEYVVYNIRLFEALTGAGDLEGMEELMHLVRAEYPTRWDREYDSEVEARSQSLLKPQYEQWYHCQSTFWLGFIRMALGDMEGAAKHLEQNISEIDSLEAKLASEEHKIDSVCPIFRDFRSRHLAEWIRDYHGKLPEHDIGELLWATEGRFTLAEAREKGKVVAIVCRRPGDVRSQTFLEEVDRFVKDRKDAGIEGVWLGFLAGNPDPANDELMLQKMRDDLGNLKVSLPAGYDPDRRAQQIVRGLYCTVGTASFAVLDRKGRRAWWMADARDLDREIAVRVLERLLAEDGPEE